MRFAVVGEHVERSFSPRIHAEFGRQTGINLQYDALSMPNFTIKNLDEYAGFNITAPYKKEAFAICNTRTEWAKKSGTVNTLTRTKAGIEGHNTDSEGFVQSCPFNGKTILLVGAGGAARAISIVLSKFCTNFFVLNRTVSAIEAIGPQYNNQSVDGIIFTVTKIPEYKYPSCKWVIDINYGAAAADSAKIAADRGAHYQDGLAMLCAQAALSFAHWHHIQPDWTSIYESLRSL